MVLSFPSIHFSKPKSTSVQFQIINDLSAVGYTYFELKSYFYHHFSIRTIQCPFLSFTYQSLRIDLAFGLGLSLLVHIYLRRIIPIRSLNSWSEIALRDFSTSISKLIRPYLHSIFTLRLCSDVFDPFCDTSSYFGRSGLKFLRRFLNLHFYAHFSILFIQKEIPQHFHKATAQLYTQVILSNSHSCMGC